jgi:hypothetical protein
MSSSPNSQFSILNSQFLSKLFSLPFLILKFSSDALLKLFFFSLFLAVQKNTLSLRSITKKSFMKRDFGLGNYTAQSLKKRFDMSSVERILIIPTADGDEHTRFSCPTSFFYLSSTGENLSDNFSSFLPRKKTSADNFQAFFHGRKPQRTFFKLSSMEENVSDNFSSFLPRKKTSADIFQAFFHGRKRHRQFFKLSSMEENVSDNFSRFLPWKKTPAAISQTFFHGRRLPQNKFIQN